MQLSWYNSYKPVMIAQWENKIMYLAVYFLHGPGSMTDSDGVFLGIDWLTDHALPIVLGQRGRTWLNLPSMAPHDLRSRTNNSWNNPYLVTCYSLLSTVGDSGDRSEYYNLRNRTAPPEARRNLNDTDRSFLSELASVRRKLQSPTTRLMISLSQKLGNHSKLYYSTACIIENDVVLHDWHE